ncbi:hypothetical protein KFE25_007584 [Diacronema lutheri]|uniref:Uncharacterized protein n=1 Tax=Diacronema lutheri TaxID=2081491 RepID=A0A8J5XU82_DIALT|nr:hypothetical protein KFE25_007584 [Diacronema lutheri]
MLACVYTALFVVVPTLALWAAHHAAHGAVLFNWTYLLLSLFCVINTMISVWEISLHVYSRWITTSFQQLKKRHEKDTFPAVFMFQDVPLRDALSVKYWSNVWILYSFFDESYSDSKSYGFWIDSGNGFSTLLPGIAFVLGMTYDLMDARHLGLLGMIQFYQEFYGTVLYFWSFFYNRRWKDHGWTGSRKHAIFALVLISNGIWFAGPGLGMYVSYHLLMRGAPAMALFRTV